MPQEYLSKHGRSPLAHQMEHGLALVTSLLYIMVFALVGITVTTITTQSSGMSGHYKGDVAALEAARAGAEEIRGRLRGSAATGVAIKDTAPTNLGWEVYMGPQAAAYGYTGASGQSLINSIVGYGQYTAILKHAAKDGQLLYWGDPNGTGVNTKNTVGGSNIYMVTSHGHVGESYRVVQTLIARTPPIPVPGLLYVEAPTAILGSSTNILGADQCGTKDVPGITTPQRKSYHDKKGKPQDTITESGNPTIKGSPAIEYEGKKINVSGLLNSFKDSANFVYTFTSKTTQTGTEKPGPGDKWGTPTAGATLQKASTCSNSNIIYYNMNDTILTLSGGGDGMWGPAGPRGS